MQKIDSVTYFLKLKRIHKFSIFFHLCTSRYLIIAISLLLGDRKKCQQLFCYYLGLRTIETFELCTVSTKIETL